MNRIEKLSGLVRNEFASDSKWGFPTIKKQKIDLQEISLLGFSRTKCRDVLNNNKTIHFFEDDYRFELVYQNHERAFEKLKQYYCLLTPDFSLYVDMPLSVQIYNTFKNRWCGALWQSLGLRVIPTIEWGDERSFEFCFDGVESGSIVAISTLGKRKIKDSFMLGYNKMIEKIKPSAIICYGKPFDEMAGNVIVFPYILDELRAKQ